MLIVLDVLADIPCILSVDFVASASASASAFVYVFTGIVAVACVVVVACSFAAFN